MTNPKICPVSGMFQEHPINDQEFFVGGAYAALHWRKQMISHQMYYDHGNCFATREDAERYAKHLKAMAKLRRLAFGMTTELYRDDRNLLKLVTHIPDDAYNQLTHEEQNALLWPNEEK